MVTKVVMPKLSLTMKEGTVGKWYKKEGDTIEKGEPIVEIISEKATYDLEAPASGVLVKILVAEGSDAPVDAPIAVITALGETYKEVETPQVSVATTERTERVLASPAAKRLAKEHDIDLTLVKGSGPEGRIVEEDVQQLIKETSGFLPRIKETVPLTGFKKTSAERVSTSFRTAPHSTLMMKVDSSKATEVHNKLQVSHTAILVKATAKALREHSIVNSTFEQNCIKIFEDVNIGVATATPHGLVVPVIRNADAKSLKEIDASIKNLTEKARDGRLAKEEISGSTFTISNLGMFGVEFFTPIINPPEAAILGVGKITETPVATNGKIEIEPIMMLSLSYDHRIIDGAPAAEFLNKIKQLVENPELLES